MYINQRKSRVGNNHQITQVGESEHQSFEPCSILTPLETTAIIHGSSANKTQMSFQDQQHNQDPIDIPVWSNEFPNSSFLFCQTFEDNYSANTNKQDQPNNSHFAPSLLPLSSSEDGISSSENYSQYGNFLSDNMPFCEHFPQEHKKVLEFDAAPDQGSIEISCQRTQWNSCTKPDKHSSPCVLAFATSNNSDSRRTATGKRRIKWTKDLHEQFIMIVNRLGGPEKAKPKAILEMMGSDVLTISNVKSHLQKYRSTLHMHTALKGRSDEGHRTDGISELQVKIQMQIEESRQLQLEIQKSNHQQLEMQQNLKVLIEQQRKQLKLMLDQQKQRTKLEKIPDSEHKCLCQNGYFCLLSCPLNEEVHTSGNSFVLHLNNNSLPFNYY